MRWSGFARSIFPAFLGLTLLGAAARAEPAAHPWEGKPFAWSAQDALQALAGLPDRDPAPEREDEEDTEPKEQKATPPKLDVDLLLEDTSCAFDADGRATRRHHMVYWVRSERGARGWAALRASWRPFFQDRPEVRARVITPDGQEHAFDQATLTTGADEDEDEDQYTDGSHVRGPLPAMKAGVLVEEETVVRDVRPLFAGGVIERFGLRTGPGSARHTRVHVEAPRSLPLHHVEHGPGFTVSARHSATLQTLDIDSGPLAEPVDVEGNLPPGTFLWPSFAVSTGASWNAVATEYADLVDQQIGQGPVADQIAEWQGSARDRVAVAQQIVGRLHKALRYTALELGAGALTPVPPIEALTRKYGDCKDMSTLVVALLRAAGFPAQVALLHATRWSDPDTKLPGISAFNHAIVYVPGSPDLWIDPTDPNVPAGELPLEDQGRLALIADHSSKVLVRTPDAGAHGNRQIITEEVHFAIQGPATVVETQELTGAFASGQRQHFRETDPKTLRDEWEKWVKKDRDAESLGRLDSSPPDDLGNPFRITFEVIKTGRGMTNDEEATTWIEPYRILKELPDVLLETRGKGPAHKRKHDFFFPMPFEAELRYVLIPPNGCVLKPLPEEIDRTGGPYKITHEFQIDPSGTAHLTYRFSTATTLLTPDDYEAVRKLSREVREHDFIAGAAWTPAQLESKGRIKEAAAAYESLISTSPKEAVFKARLARMWLRAGAGRAARDLAREAIQIDPKSAYAQATLASALSHDLIGRLHKPGFDRAGAIAAYREASRLLPKDRYYWSQYLTLLQLGNDGGPFTEGDSLEEATEGFARYRKEIKETDLDQAYVVTLLQRHQWMAVFELDPPVDATKGQMQLFLLAARTMDAGLPAALAEASRLQPDPEKEQQLLLGVAGVLAVLRQYPEAAAVVQASAALPAPVDPSVEQLREMFARAKPLNMAALADGTPTGLARQTMALLMNPSLNNASVQSLFSRGVRDAFGDDALTRWSRIGRRQLRSMGQGGSEVFLTPDIILGILDFTKEGDDRTGYRIELRPILANSGGVRSSLFVIKEGADYRIVSDSSMPELLGFQAARLLAAGQEDAARRWLDWAVETPSGARDRELTALWSAQGSRMAADIRAAAGVLMRLGPLAREAAPLLQKALAEAPDPARAQRVLPSLAWAELHEKQYQSVLDLLPRITRTDSNADETFILEQASLSGLHRYDAARTAANARLKDRPTDDLALRWLSRIERSTGHWEEAERIDQHRGELSGEEHASAMDFNEVAWIGVARGTVTETSIAAAERAAQLTRRKDRGVLNTLAAVYAGAGRLKEARTAFLESLDESGELFGWDWLVQGLLLEQYGLKQDALAAFQAATKDKDDEDPGSSTVIARHRLDALQAGSAAAEAR
jgi:tetratricopeptide (TPR) repeat protein